MGLVFFSLLIILLFSIASPSHNPFHSVFVNHFILQNWGSSTSETHNCSTSISCVWKAATDIGQLNTALLNGSLRANPNSIFVGLYNIHSLIEKYQRNYPLPCEMAVNVTMAETEEAEARFSEVFAAGMKNFDGFSSTHPNSTIQRVYSQSFMHNEDLLPRAPFSSLIQSGVYVASNCHHFRNERDKIIEEMRILGLRIDGLGKCMHKVEADTADFKLTKRKGNDNYLLDKREILSKYMFTMAFENTVEPGYVTEKAFDALLSGSIPVYYGDSNHLKALIPHPKSVIFVDDFENLSSLVKYLKHLTNNESAYETHREWFRHYNFSLNTQTNPLLSQTFQCRVCEWAATIMEKKDKDHKRGRNSPAKSDFCR